MIKILERLWIKGTYLNIRKAIYSKPSQYQIRWRETQSNSIKSETKQGCPLSPYLFNTILEVLTETIRQLKKIKRIQRGKEDVKVSLFADDRIVSTLKILPGNPYN